MSIEDCWGAIAREAERLGPVHLRDLFEADPDRFAGFSAKLDDLLIDFSKEKLDRQALGVLLDLGRAAEIEARREAMLSGEAINLTEGRAVLHTALRAPAGSSVTVDGTPVGSAVQETLDCVLAFADEIRSGEVVSSSGEPFADVVNIGIGGSDLGPVMVTRALAPDADGPRVHFVSNVDGAHLTDILKGLDPARTLVVIVSKTFTTLETMTNARSAQAWLAEAVGEAEAGAHLAAVSTNLEATAAFGIDNSRVFGIWDWVGGRYSVWSAVGLPVALAVGGDAFRSFLAGARAMDEHFATAPLETNLPVLLALIGIWRRNGLGYPTVALIPYDQRLERFPAYVQQLDMESNGKRVTRGGSPVRAATGPVIWGEPGTNAQHSFFQLIHQGTDVVPVDFIVAAKAREALGEHHDLLLANCLAQSQALAFGKTEEAVRGEMQAGGADAAEIARLAPHRVFPGDRPSTTILHRELDAYSLGRLVALFEHKVFVQGVIWDVNSFDQWGVELGKQLTGRLIPALKGEEESDDLDASTHGLIGAIRRRRS